MRCGSGFGALTWLVSRAADVSQGESGKVAFTRQGKSGKGAFPKARMKAVTGAACRS